MAERGIVAAAVQIDGLTISMPAPARHHDILWGLDAMGVPLAKIGSATQGFLDHRGVFVGRSAARIVAANWEQITPGKRDAGGDLYSEDLW